MTQNHKTMNEAIEALKRKDFVAARAVVADIDVAEFTLTHFMIKGLAELSLQKWAEARATFTLASERFPDDALFWLNRGIAEENLELVAEATASMERCAALNPSLGEAFGNLSNLYTKQKRFGDAETAARKALELGASKGDVLNSLGLSLGKQGKHGEADEVFAEALRVATNNAAVALNRANLAVDRLKFDEAWMYFAQARALADSPTMRHDEGLARLLAGDWQQGWELIEARLEMPNALRLMPPCPRWSGENLAGKKLMIVAEQGFGDVIQFCRYGRFLPDDADLIWVAPKILERLLSGQVRGVVIAEGGDLPICDYWVAMMSLPLALDKPLPQEGLKDHLADKIAHTHRCDEDRPSSPPPRGDPAPSVREALESLSRGHAMPDPRAEAGMTALLNGFSPPIPPFPAYLTAPALPVLPTGKHARKIGLVWAGSPTHRRDHERSLKLEQLAPVLDGVEAEFYAPFVGAALDQIGARKIIRLDSLISDFADTAALVKQMDCVITVDTAIAHLAGALGVRTYLLLPFCPDWRWGVAGETTPWYASMILLRQPIYGDWASVIEALRKSLIPNP